MSVFRLLRMVLIGLLLGLLLGLVAVATYRFVHNPNYQRELSQRAEEVREDYGDDKIKSVWNGTVVVTDAVKGDKLVIDTETIKHVTVRLVGIDAPELPAKRGKTGQPLAEESRQRLADLTKDKAVEMAIVGTDGAKLPLVLLTLDGVLINAKMAEAGLAEATSEGADKLPAKLRHAIENAELKAKEKRIGIWGLTNYVRPVEYRIRQH